MAFGESILYRFGADSSKFTKGLLGMEQKAKKSSQSIVGSFGKVKGMLAGGLGLAGVGAVAALALEATRAGSEIKELSNIAGATSVEFQKQAAAAKSVNVESEKLADIYKDVNDKVGDFLVTGGGPLKDFFEQVAPKVGVTAEQFKNLSGPEALQLYVDSLEKANVGQKKMTFFMEAIASDATRLIPLLKDGGTGFKTLGDEAERAGRILDEKTIDQLDRSREALDRLKQDAVLLAGRAVGIGYSIFDPDPNQDILATGVAKDLPNELLGQYVDFETRLKAVRDAMVELRMEGEKVDEFNVHKRAMEDLTGVYDELGEAVAVTTTKVDDAMDAIAAQNKQLAKEAKFDAASAREQWEMLNNDLGDVTRKIIAGDGDQGQLLRERERVLRQLTRIDQQIQKDAERSELSAERQKEEKKSEIRKEVRLRESKSLDSVEEASFRVGDFSDVKDLGGGRRLVTRRDGDRIVQTTAGENSRSSTSFLAPEAALRKAFEETNAAQMEVLNQQLEVQQNQLAAITRLVGGTKP